MSQLDLLPLRVPLLRSQRKRSSCHFGLVVSCALVTLLLVVAFLNAPWRLPAAILEDFDEDGTIEALVEQMTLDEKISLVHGAVSTCGYTGFAHGVPRLKIPSLRENDGPQGFRGGPKGSSTAFPSALSIAATFSAADAFAWGKAIAKEFADKGANMLLGPGLNVMRVPENGRTFEYLSGEDPHLGAVLGAATIQGMHSVPKIIANAKHFILNNQETNRMSISSVVNEVVLNEVYLAPFKAAVEAGVLSVMCAYNRINGTHACENESTLQRKLKDEWGFKGFVVSDWLATHSTSAAALAGLDQEMPLGLFFGCMLKDEVKRYPELAKKLDDKVSRILYALKSSAQLPGDDPDSCNVRSDVTTEINADLAVNIAVRGAVLLRNENRILPFKNLKKVALFGKTAKEKHVVTGKGSGHVDGGHNVVTLEHGLKKALLDVSWNKLENDASVAIIAVACSSGEGFDRRSLSFDEEDVDLINSVSSSARDRGIPIVVIAVAPGPVTMPWADKVDAVVLSFLPGQGFGDAMADIILGKQSPGGRLPVTIPHEGKELIFMEEQYPGIDGIAEYTENLMIGYKWFDHFRVEPHYPFGFGLTFTEFELDSTSVLVNETSPGRDWEVAITVRNSGEMRGRLTLQVYLQLEEQSCIERGIVRPKKRLVGFRTVEIDTGSSSNITVALDNVLEWAGDGFGLGSLCRCKYSFVIGLSSNHTASNVPFHSSSC